jgi:hypothetical protein
MELTLERTVEQLAQQAGSRFFGKYRGSVTDNDDPDGLGRIMATVPAVMGEVPVGWALPAFPFAGDGHGQVMLPEVGSAVWIEFEAGNLNYPIWSGGFFLQSQSPPDPKGVSVRVIVSKNNHQVVLDDESDKVIVKHSGGATIEMSATEISLTIGASKMVMGLTSITFNEGVVKIGPAGVSLAQGAMTLGLPPT